MKIQDIIFFVMFIFLALKRDVKWVTIAGLLSLFLSIPLFASWIFFTAERLTWYAAAFFFIAICFYLFRRKKDD